MNREVCDGVRQVGFVDWLIRDFHGYRTSEGSSYNAYLISDRKTALVDTVKRPYVDKLLSHMAETVSPEKVDYVVCNHAEPDHAGGLAAVMEACSNATLVCDSKCIKTLSSYHDTADWPTHIVGDGDSISLGERTIQFMETPMVHWPESMFTYIPEQKVLFSMDAFGQHYASAHDFDDEVPQEKLMYEAKKYYANILMLYSKPIQKTLQRALALDIEMLAPSHGVIWRSRVKDILAAYDRWTRMEPEAKVVVAFDSMWDSTEQMGRAIVDGAREKEVDVEFISAHEGEITRLATEMLDAAAAAFGSATLNQTLMPSMAGALTYLKGLKPSGKAGFAFGSYGWSRGGAADVEKYLRDMKFNLIREPLVSQYRPAEDVLEECREAGRRLADAAINKAC